MPNTTFLPRFLKVSSKDHFSSTIPNICCISLKLSPESMRTIDYAESNIKRHVMWSHNSSIVSVKTV